ncbi:MAG: right-handed parallel beta-helix repeat-containing protein, partial [Planctomycetes bacterium]|nr:right-handed parallel beta-helix repeat-containing protein [Planctomycetota bacterium]
TITEINLIGIGLTGPPEINVKQGSNKIPDKSDPGYDFGTLSVQEQSDFVTFTIENFGSEELAISSIGFSSGDYMQFQIDDSEQDSSLLPAQSTTFRINFAPITSGDKKAIVSITNNDADENPFTFAIVGKSLNLAPEISDANVTPYITRANGKDTVTFSAKVTDPNGIHDISSVYVGLQDIDGHAEQKLFDDGTNGDVTEKDGIYTVEYTMPDITALYGFHDIEFTVEDNSGETASASVELVVAGNDIIHVSDSLGNDNTGDGSEQNPYKTIQKGIHVADISDGDLVWVHDGTYKGGSSTSISRNRDLDFGGKKIIVYGNPENPNAVTIDCEGTSNDPHRGFKFDSGETNDSILTGFTITKGYATTVLDGGNKGGGIYLSNSNPTIQNCNIYYNVSKEDGGGIYCTHSSPIIKKCTISSNSAVAGYSADGGGIHCNYSNALIQNCIINNNSVNGGSYSFGAGISILYDSPTINNCLIMNNYITSGGNRYGGGIHCRLSNPTIQNCTISNNQADNGGGLYSWDNATPTIIDTISWGNTATKGNEIYVDSGSGEVTITYCDVGTDTNDIVDSGNKINANMSPNGLNAGNGAPQNNISQDPRFVRGINGEYYLNEGSTCIGAGSETVGNITFLDDVNHTTGNKNERYSSPSETVDMGYHYSRFAGNIYYVDDANGNDSTGNGSSTNPFKTIQKGICASQTGDLVLVAKGTYKGGNEPSESRNRDLDFAEGLISGTRDIILFAESRNAPKDTIIDCEGTSTNPHRGFYFHSGETNSAILNGFTIINGYVDSGAVARDDGGGILCMDSNPKIINCIINENTATDDGGGICCDTNSSAVIENCRISNNTTTNNGGGVYSNYSSPTITNCMISGNTASDGGGIFMENSNSIELYNCLISNNKATQDDGGGITVNSSVITIRNSSIVNNTTHDKGGGIFFQNNPTGAIVDSIIWGNRSNNNDGHQFKANSSGSYEITYCNIADNNLDPDNFKDDGNNVNKNKTPKGFVPGQYGNISANPRFVLGLGPNGRYYLEHNGVDFGTQDSPCINAGSANVSTFPYIANTWTRTDQAADSGLVDMGFHYYNRIQFQKSKLIGQYLYPSDIYCLDAVAFENGVAYVGRRHQNHDMTSISAMDVTNPSNINEISSLTLNTHYWSTTLDIKISGDYLIVANNLPYTYVVDKSNTNSLSIKDSISFNFGCTSVAVLNNTYYYAEMGLGHDGALKTINWSDPSNIREVHSIGGLKHGSQSQGICISGNYLYTVWIYCGGSPGLRIYDISNPAVPVQVGTLVTEDFNNSIVVDGNYAYIASYTNLYKIDISNKSNPIIVDTIPHYLTSVWDMKKVGNYILVSRSNHGLYIYYDNGNSIELREIIKPPLSNNYFWGFDVDINNKRIILAQSNNSANDEKLLIYDASWLE